MVAVYEYEITADPAGDTEQAPRKATAAFIRSVGGKIIAGTEEDVDASKLTPAGEFDPMPLGAGPTNLA